MAFNPPMEYNPLGHSTAIAPDGQRSPDTRSDPGAPTDQSLAPPAMPARADSRPDFVRGFGLDVPEETEEELEQEQDQAVQDGQDDNERHEEEWVLAEASHVARVGSDDTMDMDLDVDEADVDEADAEVGSITTAAQSRVHSRHVSRLSASLSLLTVGGHVSDREIESDHEQRERGGDLEDDAIGEWTGSEDMPTTIESTEDEVRKFFLPRCFHAPSHFLRIYLITTSCFVSPPSHPLSFYHHLPFHILFCLVSRRALASGQTHLTKNTRVKNANNAASCVVPTFNGSKNPVRSPAVSQNSLIPP